MRTTKLAGMAVMATLCLTTIAQAAATTDATTPVISTDVSCATQGSPVTIIGQGFTPGREVSIGGATLTTATPDADGAFTADVLVFRTPGEDGEPVDVKLTADQEDTHVSTTLPVLSELGIVDADFRGGSLRGTITWTFLGFQPGKPIYAFYRSRGRTLGRAKMGVAGPPCGGLRVRKPRVPRSVRLRKGKLTVVLTQVSPYSSKAPQTQIRLRIG